MPAARFSLLLLIAMLVLPTALFAQNADSFLQSNDKIYIPVLVLATIFAGIILFLIYLDRKLRRLEKEKNSA